MKFSILTPSFRQLGWLKRCVRSVADQQGVEVEHLIQDANTGFELEHWVRWETKAHLHVEPDRGVYDGLNRALTRITGDVFCILKCREQLLPGALSLVRDEFKAHPEADMVVGDFLLVSHAMKLLASRRATPLRPAMILTDHLYNLPCAIFFRSSLLKRPIRFNPDYRSAGEADWMARLLRSGVNVRYLHQPLAASSVLDSNLSPRAEQQDDLRRLRAITPRWAVLAGPLLRQVRRLEELVAASRVVHPLEYEVYASDEAIRRTRFKREKQGFRIGRQKWIGR